jgi:hypothetical protein
MTHSCTCPHCQTEFDLSEHPEDQCFSCQCEAVIYPSNTTETRLACYHCGQDYQITADLFNQQLSCDCGITFTVTTIKKLLPKSVPVKKKVATVVQKQKSKALPIFATLLIICSAVGYYIFQGKSSSVTPVSDAVPVLVPNPLTAIQHELIPILDKGYSYGYWLNGYRRNPQDKSPDALCFETEKFGFSIEPQKLSTPRFGLFDKSLDYKQALAAGTARMDSLKEARLDIELQANGKTYRAQSANSRFSMWDSGRIAQYFTLLDLNFKDESGKKVDVYGDLNLVAWPGSLSLTVDDLRLKFKDGGFPGKVGNGWYVNDKPLDIPHRPELEPEKLTLEVWVKLAELKNGAWLINKSDFGFMVDRNMASAIMNVKGEHHSKQQKLQSWDTMLKPDTWYHLAMTYDSKVLRLYFNGKEEASMEVNIPRPKGKGHMRIGQRADGYMGTNQGVYDEIRLWNRALSAEEIKAHWQTPEKLSNRAGLVLDNNFDTEKVIVQPDWTDTKLRVSLETDSQNWLEEKIIKGSWKPGETKQINLNCNIDSLYDAGRNISITLASPYKNQTFPVVFDPLLNCYVSEVMGLKRSFKNRYVKITDYDEFDIILNCPDESPQPVPFLLDLNDPANVTGMVPILCQPDGTPTGIPVQLTKNWHSGIINSGKYLRAYTLIPVKQGVNHYRMRVPYTFYGSVPSASHGQLCLLSGKGGVGQRWDQLALASGGETLCLDIDQCLSDQIMTDIRIPLGQGGSYGKNPWGWTRGGWGGEWLGVFKDKKKLHTAAMKAAYLSHGPCLTDVRYNGAYGSGKDVLMQAQIQFPRTNDYARTFQKLKYIFQKNLSTQGSYLHRLFPGAIDKKVSYGNAKGLLGEIRITEEMKEGHILIPPTELKGPGPWWVGTPERHEDYTGYPAIIIRGYKTSFAGKIGKNPWLSVSVGSSGWGTLGADVRLIPPPEVKNYKPGDYVGMDLEWAHLVSVADNYGWNNETYRNALKIAPNSWRLAHREAVQNNIQLKVEGGKLIQKLPIVIQADQPEVTVFIKGGIAYLPIRFENLKTADNYVIYEIVGGREELLDQSVHGNDYWQTDYDAGSGTYKMSFNLPVDGKNISKWLLAPYKPVFSYSNDFESYKKGDQPKGAYSYGKATVSVTDAVAASGKNCLAFKDMKLPRPHYPFFSHTAPVDAKGSKLIAMSFDIMISADKPGAMKIDFRDYSKNPMTSFSVSAEADGHIVIGDRKFKAPLGSWHRVNLLFDLRDPKRQTVSGSITGKEFGEQQFDLEIQDLTTITWYGFHSSSNVSSDIYVDNIQFVCKPHQAKKVLYE